MPGSETYFVRGNGKKLGPFTLDHLRSAVVQKRLRPDHQLSLDGTTWFDAARIWDRLAASLTSTSADSPPVRVAASVAEVSCEQSISDSPVIAINTKNTTSSNSGPLPRLKASPEEQAAVFQEESLMFYMARTASGTTALICVGLTFTVIWTLSFPAGSMDAVSASQWLPRMLITGFLLCLLGNTFLLLWMRQVYAFLRSRAHYSFTCPFGFAACGYFIPLIGIITSHIAMKELSQAATDETGRTRRHEPVGIAVYIWSALRTLALVLIVAMFISEWRGYRREVSFQMQPPPRTRAEAELRRTESNEIIQSVRMARLWPAGAALSYAGALATQVFMVANIQRKLRESMKTEPTIDDDSA